ncbi:hypothetical protein E7742_21455 [Rhodococcus sp. SGAir0479]|nr:hypothetical protein E7742_21455 [Rhodococcus sp. SGAir0479]
MPSGGAIESPVTEPGNLAEVYRDEIRALALATQRPTSVIRHGQSSYLCVEFEFDRFLLATNSPDGELGLATRGGADSDLWTVRVFDRPARRLLALERSEWLVDALDESLLHIRQRGHWIHSDLKFGELTAPGTAVHA